MENITVNMFILQLEGLKVTPQSSIPAFILLLLIYVFIMVSNVGLVLLISMERSLHQPMYLLFCNMSINDVFGATIIIPRLLSDVFIPIRDRYITYIDCVIQAFFGHIHASTTHTVLMIMAFDRVRLSRCRWIVFNPFCDNASLFKLSCESVIINNIYGLTYTVILLGSSLGSITLTYLRIAMVCLRSRNNVLNSRALQTCATHLALYVIMFVSGITTIVLHRFPDLSDHRKLASIMFHVVPPAMNAIIYGLQIKIVRQKIFIMFSRNATIMREVK
uniref:G-protein coupled receptors family 1 profile domain-containing protein n=1 Tax=Scophthalmus maximus TaxID=52904 RepID=A0A8D3CCV5_SCOMX